MRFSVLKIAVATLLLGGGCATTAPPDEPSSEAAREAWIQALSSGSSDRVWDMLGPSARARFKGSRAFHAWCQRYCAELLVSAASSERSRLSAQVGKTVLMRTPGGWRVAGDPSIPATHTAVGALWQLHGALAKLTESRVLTAAEQVRVARFVEGLERVASRLAPPNDRALSLDIAGGRVRLVRKSTGWQIASWSLPVELPPGN